MSGELPAPTQAEDGGRRFEFRIGDVFDANDDLSLWAANLSMAFNDLVFANDRMDKAEEAWERFHWSRLAFAHLNEVMLYLREKESNDHVIAFIQELSTDARNSYSRALALYEENRAVLNYIRDNAVFHYPRKSGVKKLRAALSAASDAVGEHGSSTGKIRDSRLNYADDIQAIMVVNAFGGRIEGYEAGVASIAELTASLMNFLNHALDHFFVVRGARDTRPGR